MSYTLSADLPPSSTSTSYWSGTDKSHGSSSFNWKTSSIRRPSARAARSVPQVPTRPLGTTPPRRLDAGTEGPARERDERVFLSLSKDERTTPQRIHLDTSTKYCAFVYVSRLETTTTPTALFVYASLPTVPHLTKAKTFFVTRRRQI